MLAGPPVFSLAWYSVSRTSIVPKAEACRQTSHSHFRTPKLSTSRFPCRIGHVAATTSPANDLGKPPLPRAAKSGASRARNGDSDTDLQAVIDAWPTLPDAVKVDIVAMAQD